MSWNSSSPRQEHFPSHSTSAGLGKGSHLAEHDPTDIKTGNPTHTGLGIFLFPGNGCKFQCKCPCKWSCTAILISGPNLNIPSLVESRFPKNSLHQPPSIPGFSSSSLNPVPGRVFRIRSAMGTGGWGPSLLVPCSSPGRIFPRGDRLGEAVPGSFFVSQPILKSILELGTCCRSFGQVGDSQEWKQ